MDFIWLCSNFHSINLNGDCRKIFLKNQLFTIGRNYERKLYRPSCIIIQYQLFRFWHSNPKLRASLSFGYHCQNFYRKFINLVIDLKINLWPNNKNSINNLMEFLFYRISNFFELFSYCFREPSFCKFSRNCSFFEF